MRMTMRVAALHGALWGHDRWYRLAWQIWPVSLALLICGWICIGKPAGTFRGAGPISGNWARPVTQNLNGNNTAAHPNWVQDEMKKCFTNRQIFSCTGLISTGQVRGDRLASVYAQRGFLQRDKPDLAMADYNTALKVQPNLTDALDGRAWLHMTRSEYDAAIEDLNKAIGLLPPASSGSAHYYRGFSFLRLEKYPQALIDLNDAQKYQPDNAEIYLTRGEVEQAQENYDVALQDFDEFSRRMPKDARGLIRRSYLLEATNRNAEALTAMENALTLDPGNEDVRSERDRMRGQQNDHNSSHADAATNGK